MFARMIQFCLAFLFALALTASSSVVTLAGNDGIVRVKSAYPIGETIDRLKKDIADKGIKFFSEIDQSKLAGGRRDQAAAIGAAHLRQSAARHAVHHRQRECRPGLAGAPARVRER